MHPDRHFLLLEEEGVVCLEVKESDVLWQDGEIALLVAMWAGVIGIQLLFVIELANFIFLFFIIIIISFLSFFFLSFFFSCMYIIF